MLSDESLSTVRSNFCGWMPDAMHRMTRQAEAPGGTSVRWQAVRHGTLLAGLVWIVAQATGFVGPFTDARAYWLTGQGPWYATTYGIPDAFSYSPAFAQFIAPLVLLPWPVFAGVWAAILFGSLAWLTGRWLPLVILAPPVAFELYAGNIHILLAAAIAIGYRYPALWAFVLLTKVTPGIGLLWFAIRREWRSLGVALGATGIVVVVSFALAPDAWGQWLAYLSGARQPPQPTAIPIPLIVRVVPAVSLVVWGAMTDRPWTVPVGAMLALPVLWWGSLAMLLVLLREQRVQQVRGQRVPGLVRVDEVAL